MRMILLAAVLAFVSFASPVALADGTRAGCASPSPDIRIRNCADLIASGKYEPADVALFHYNRALAYSEKGNSQAAIADYDRAIAINPNNASFFYNRSVEHDKKGDALRAIEDLDETIRLDPERTAAYYNRGTIYFKGENYDLAIASLDKAIALDPGHADALVNREVPIGPRATTHGRSWTLIRLSPCSRGTRWPMESGDSPTIISATQNWQSPIIACLCVSTPTGSGLLTFGDCWIS